MSETQTFCFLGGVSFECVKMSLGKKQALCCLYREEHHIDDVYHFLVWKALRTHSFKDECNVKPSTQSVDIYTIPPSS